LTDYWTDGYCKGVSLFTERTGELLLTGVVVLLEAAFKLGFPLLLLTLPFEFGGSPLLLLTLPFEFGGSPLLLTLPFEFGFFLLLASSRCPDRRF